MLCKVQRWQLCNCGFVVQGFWICNSSSNGTSLKILKRVSIRALGAHPENAVPQGSLMIRVQRDHSLTFYWVIPLTFVHRFISPPYPHYYLFLLPMSLPCPSSGSASSWTNLSMLLIGTKQTSSSTCYSHTVDTSWAIMNRSCQSDAIPGDKRSR